MAVGPNPLFCIKNKNKITRTNKPISAASRKSSRFVEDSCCSSRASLNLCSAAMRSCFRCCTMASVSAVKLAVCFSNSIRVCSAWDWAALAAAIAFWAICFASSASPINCWFRSSDTLSCWARVDATRWAASASCWALMAASFACSAVTLACWTTDTQRLRLKVARIFKLSRKVRIWMVLTANPRVADWNPKPSPHSFTKTWAPVTRSAGRLEVKAPSWTLDTCPGITVNLSWWWVADQTTRPTTRGLGLNFRAVMSRPLTFTRAKPRASSLWITWATNSAPERDWTVRRSLSSRKLAPVKT